MVTRLLQRLKVIALNWACLLAGVASAHILTGDPDHPHYDWSVQPPMTVAPVWFIAQADPTSSRTQNVLTAIPPNLAKVPPQSEVFTLFSPWVMVHWN